MSGESKDGTMGGAPNDQAKEKIQTVEYAGDELFTVHTVSGHDLTVDFKSGRRSAPGPLELFIAGLATCTASDVVSILHKKREQITGYKVEIRTQRRPDHPRAFTRIELTHIIHGHHVSPEAVERAVELSTGKYCSAVATVRPTADVVTKYEIHESDRVPEGTP
jgi:putative redox protein